MSDLTLPLTQSFEFERTCNMLELPVQRVDSDVGTCLVQSRKLPVCGRLNLVSRGPVLREQGGGRNFIDRLRKDVRGPLIINAPARGMGAGLKIMPGAQLAMIDLVPSDQMRAGLHQKWRNQLNKGEGSPLIVRKQSLNARRHQWFLEAEQAQQRARKYRSYPAGFLLAFAAANPGRADLYTALLKGKPVAAMLILKHGAMATYQAGVTSADGRRHCAHNLLLWRIACELQKNGTRHLDLGRADLSDGLRRFKCGAGARLETLPGTYVSVGAFWPRRMQALPADRSEAQTA